MNKPQKRSWFKIPAFKFGLPAAAATAAMIVLVFAAVTHRHTLIDKGKAEHDPATIVVKDKAPPPKVLPKEDMKVAELPESKAYTGMEFDEEASAAAPMMKMSGTIAFSSVPGSRRPDKGMPFSRYVGPMDTERYDRIYENDFIMTSVDPLSTFSIDVDTASYSNVRRFLNSGAMPPKDSVRIEEMINYFPYDYPKTAEDKPFSVDVETAASPWHEKYKLVRIAIKGKDIDWSSRPKSNLVFLIDVSGSMMDENKLPLLKRSLKLLTDQLTKQDRVSMVVYAGAAGVVLPPTKGNNIKKIVKALDNLEAGGSTAGGAGIELAYKTAQKNFIKGGLNRVILATDGDFNVGTTNEGDLTRLIEKKAKSGIFLSVLGFGMGNYNDSTMEKLADKGNGNYAYIDNFQEARKVMIEQLSGLMLTIAKDVKIQIEFNPSKVNAYRLIGYENRILEHQDFNDDKKDAGEIGAGHTVTALYEIVPAGVKIDIPSVDPLKYQKPSKGSETGSDDLLTLKIRYKKPDGKTSSKIEFEIPDSTTEFKDASEDFKFASAVASFGMILRDSKYKGKIDYKDVIKMAIDGKGKDTRGYRGEFIRLVETAKGL